MWRAAHLNRPPRFSLGPMPRRIHVRSNSSPGATADATASLQFGLIERDQALESGVTKHMIDYRLETGEWRPFLPGVYALRSSVPSWLRSEMGAVLWAGRDDAAASGRAGGVLWGFDGIDANVVEISTTNRVRRKDIVVHHSDDLGTIKRRRGIPVTDPFRTIVDLASLVPTPVLEAALDSGLRTGLLNLPYLEKVMAASSGRRGMSGLRVLMDERIEGLGLTMSALEALVSNFLRKQNIPGGYRNYEVHVDGKSIAILDVAWPELKVGIEVDSRRWHLGHAAWERDSARYGLLASLGWLIIPITSYQLRRNPGEIAERVFRLLGQRRFDFA